MYERKHIYVYVYFNIFILLFVIYIFLYIYINSENMKILITKLKIKKWPPQWASWNIKFRYKTIDNSQQLNLAIAAAKLVFG